MQKTIKGKKGFQKIYTPEIINKIKIDLSKGILFDYIIKNYNIHHTTLNRYGIYKKDYRKTNTNFSLYSNKLIKKIQEKRNLTNNI